MFSSSLSVSDDNITPIRELKTPATQTRHTACPLGLHEWPLQSFLTAGSCSLLTSALGVRHEVARVFIKDDPVFCHRDPTGTCVGGNPGVRSTERKGPITEATSRFGPMPNRCRGDGRPGAEDQWVRDGRAGNRSARSTAWRTPKKRWPCAPGVVRQRKRSYSSERSESDHLERRPQGDAVRRLPMVASQNE